MASRFEPWEGSFVFNNKSELASFTAINEATHSFHIIRVQDAFIPAKSDVMIMKR